MSTMGLLRLHVAQGSALLGGIVQSLPNLKVELARLAGCNEGAAVAGDGHVSFF